MKVVFNNETKRFGFLFDGIRKIGNTLPLTKEEYSLFGIAGIIYNYSNGYEVNRILSEFEVNEYWKIIRKLIATYGEHADEALLTIIINSIIPKLDNSFEKMHYYVYKKQNELRKIIASTYDKVKDRPMYELTRSIGSGVSGIAIPGGFFNTSKDTVVKRSMHPFDKCTLVFYQYCMNVGGKFLPKIYWFDEDTVEMETLKVGTPKCFKFLQELNQALELREQGTKHKESTYVKNWIDEIDKFSKDLGMDIFYLDLHEGNIGENSKGDIVLFDPIGPMQGDQTQKVNYRYSKRLDRLFDKWNKNK